MSEGKKKDRDILAFLIIAALAMFAVGVVIEAKKYNSYEQVR